MPTLYITDGVLSRAAYLPEVELLSHSGEFVALRKSEALRYLRKVANRRLKRIRVVSVASEIELTAAVLCDKVRSKLSFEIFTLKAQTVEVKLYADSALRRFCKYILVFVVGNAVDDVEIVPGFVNERTGEVRYSHLAKRNIHAEYGVEAFQPQLGAFPCALVAPDGEAAHVHMRRGDNDEVEKV